MQRLGHSIAVDLHQSGIFMCIIFLEHSVGIPSFDAISRSVIVSAFFCCWISPSLNGFSELKHKCVESHVQPSEFCSAKWQRTYCSIFNSFMFLIGVHMLVIAVAAVTVNRSAVRGSGIFSPS